MPPVSSSYDSDSSDTEDNEPLLTRHYRKVRSDSESEDNIPLFELRRRLRDRKTRQQAEVLTGDPVLSFTACSVLF